MVIMVIEVSLIHQAASFLSISPYTNHSGILGWSNHIDSGSLEASFVSTAISGLESLIQFVVCM